MNKHEKAIEAAKYLKEYCGSLKECKRCVFKIKYRSMIYCKLKKEDPATWDIDREVDK